VALGAIARSRTETGEPGRAGAMLLAYREDPSFCGGADVGCIIRLPSAV